LTDLISKTKVIDLLIKRRDHYRHDTDVGLNLRKGIDEAIADIDNQFERGLFTLAHMGESDLTDILREAQDKLNTLIAEPEIKVFCINGRYNYRYTLCHAQAKIILKEEFALILDDIDVDYADSKMDIQMKTIKQSNLKDYTIESLAEKSDDSKP
jgi:hypothetical protein